jgi:hypothetical protein
MRYNNMTDPERRNVLEALSVFCEEKCLDFNIKHLNDHDFISFLFYLICEYATGETTKGFILKAKELKSQNKDRWTEGQKVAISNTYENIMSARARKSFLSGGNNR